MKKFEKILTDLKEKSPLNYLYDNCYTPDTVKQEIVTTLKPFFSNIDNLNEYAIKFLVSDWIEFLKLKAFHNDAEGFITEIVSHYNKAKSRNPAVVFTTINSLMPLQVDAGNKFWSFLKLELDKSTLAFEEFAQTSMKDISDLVEGLMKVLLYENLAIDRVNRNKVIDIEKIQLLDLGVIVEELATNSPFGPLFKIQPENLKVSDWRNIAAHHNHKLLGDNKILCEYGPKENRKNITVTRDELFDRVSKIYYSLQLLNISHKFFSFDNLKDIVNIQPPVEDKNGRDEIGFLMFASSVNSQGFEIESIDFKDGGDALMVIKDLTDGNPTSRGIHASQLVYPLWFIAESNTSTIEYKTKVGETYLKATTTKEVCEKIKSGDKTLEYLAEHVKFEIAKNGL
jgi:hypothetical protein